MKSERNKSSLQTFRRRLGTVRDIQECERNLKSIKFNWTFECLFDILTPYDITIEIGDYDDGALQAI